MYLLQYNVSEWSNMFIGGLLFQQVSTIKNPAKHVGLVQMAIIIISSIVTCSHHHITGVKQQSHTLADIN